MTALLNSALAGRKVIVPDNSPPKRLTSSTPNVYSHPVLETALLKIFAAHGDLLNPNESHAVEAGGMVLRLSIEFPADKQPVPEGQCETDVFDTVLELFKQLGRRVVAKEIFAHLESSDRLWGRSTATNALASLTRKGILVNLRDKRGYGPSVAKG